MNKCVILLCGAPGSGKSTFSFQLKEQLLCHSSDVLSPFILSYDEVSKDLLRGSDALTFKQIRTHTLSLLEEMLQDTNANNVFIVDDTMHYHSMRREVYTKVRDLGATMQVVWLQCDVNTSIARDSYREAAACVGEETVRKIYGMFEAPRDENIWERAFLSVDTTDTNSISVGIETICSRATASVMKPTAVTVTASPATDLIAKSNAQEGQFDLHKAELSLRKCTSHIIKYIQPLYAAQGLSISKPFINALNKAKSGAILSLRDNIDLANEKDDSSTNSTHAILSLERVVDTYCTILSYLLPSSMPELGTITSIDCILADVRTFFSINIRAISDSTT